MCDEQTDRETDRQRDRQTDRQRDRQTDRQIDRQTDRLPADRDGSSKLYMSKNGKRVIAKC